MSIFIVDNILSIVANFPHGPMRVNWLQLIVSVQDLQCLKTV